MEIFKDSVLIAAHPDDENLWFSSILREVDRVILCFLPVPSNPILTEGRRQSLLSYPLAKLSCLELPESEVFWGADWRRPIETHYGLKIIDTRLSDKTYVGNFDVLKQLLRERLQGCHNVFTHNPWGEYGHVEHVQVYRVVKALQEEMQFNLWFSNYVSNKSVGLMATVLEKSGLESVTLETDKKLAKCIAGIYRNNRCWTWYDDYTWPDYESFIKDGIVALKTRRYGLGASINFLKIETPPPQPCRLALYFESFRKKIGL